MKIRRPLLRPDDRAKRAAKIRQDRSSVPMRSVACWHPALSAGEAGTVYLCHPFLTPATQPTSGLSAARFMAKAAARLGRALPVHRRADRIRQARGLIRSKRRRAGDDGCRCSDFAGTGRYRLAILTGIRSESKRWPSVTTDSPPERPDRMTISSAVDLLTSTGLTRATASSTT